MRRFLARFVRAGAFITKEINEVRRQPRLVLSLILGPFLILLLFGIGYKGESSNLTAIVVVPKTGDYSQDPAQYQKMTGGRLVVTDVTADQQAAFDRLNRHEVDLVVALPADASKQISSGTQARVFVYFNEVDPLRGDFIRYLTYIYISEINKQTLAQAAGQGQESAGSVRTAIDRLRNSLAAIETRLSQGDVGGASKEASSAQTSVANMQLMLILMAQLMGNGSGIIKPASPQDPAQANLSQSQDVAQRVVANLLALNQDLANPNPDVNAVHQRITAIRSDLDTLDKITQQFQTINPLVLAAPFYGEAINKAPISAGFTSYFAPSVLVLLLQHIAVTLASLSVVRDRLLGTMELFRVSPVSPGEILTGKYISFILFLAVIALVLLVMMSNEITIGGIRLSLGVPILGDYGMLALTLGLVIFASIGLGFFISAVSKSESQAVQLSMIVLLCSVFFSGFFLRLETIWAPVQVVSYALPVTYGISALQVIMLRGGDPNWILLAALFTLGIFFALLSFLLFKREYRSG